MSLADIKNKLYKKEPEKDLSRHAESEFDPVASSQNENGKVFSTKDAWEKKKGGLSPEQKKAIKIGAIVLGAIILIIGAVFAVYKIKQSAFSIDRVSVEVTGPAESESGKSLTFEINYKNDNRVNLENAVLRVTYPENFKPEESSNFKPEGLLAGSFNLGEIKKNSTGKAILNGRMFSPTGSLIYIKASLIYNPSNLSSQFTATGQMGINVSSAPITLEIMAPQNVSSGDEVNYLITYKNTGEKGLDSLKLRLIYADGFTFSHSDPAVFESNSIWYIGQLASGQEGKIVVNGKLEGERDEVKPIKAQIGVDDNGNFVSFSEESADTKIFFSPLTIAQTVNGVTSLNVNPGDHLQFEINYKNEGNIGMNDVVIKEILDSPVLDYSTLDKEGGAFDINDKTITWKASDYKGLKSLEPGQSGNIHFSIKVKNVIPVSGANDKNFVISSLAKIDSPDVVTSVEANKIIAGNKMDIKLNSKLVLDVRGYYNDSMIKNSGPVPPKVGEETTYTLHWLASNVSNDIGEAKVETVLPTTATFTGKIFPEDSRLTYNERNNSLVWDIGKLEAGKGILSPELEVSFQVKIKPSPDQVGREVNLLGMSDFSAKDLFTGENIKFSADGKTTNLIEDSGLSGHEVVN